MVGAIVAIALLVRIAGLHVYWALGGPAGMSVTLPERNGTPVFKPSKVSTFVVACIIFAAAGLIVVRIGVMAPPAIRPFVHAATWLLVLVFAARAVGDFRYVGFFKRVRDTRFARLDTLIYSPLCCVLAASIGAVALS